MFYHGSMRLFLLFVFFSFSTPFFCLSQPSSILTPSPTGWNFLDQNKALAFGAMAFGVGSLCAYKVYKRRYKNSKLCKHKSRIFKHRLLDVNPHNTSLVTGNADQVRYVLANTNKIIDFSEAYVHGFTSNCSLYNITQLRVAQQLGAKCGPHALKNVIYGSLLVFSNDSVSKQSILRELSDQSEVERLIGSSGAWFKKLRKDEWLNKEEIEYLIKHEREEKYINSSENVIDYISVIDNCDNLESTEYDETFLTVCKSMRDPQASCVRGFLVGNMQQHSDKKGASGHWYGFVINQVKGTVQILVLDSLNTSKIDDSKIKKILEYILVNADYSAMTQRLYFNDGISSLLDLAVKYIADERSFGEYSQEERKKSITLKIEALQQKLEEHSRGTSPEIFDKIKEFINVIRIVISASNLELSETGLTKKYLKTFTEMRELVNKTCHLKSDSSDDFDVPLQMWCIVKNLEKKSQTVAHSIAYGKRIDNVIRLIHQNRQNIASWLMFDKNLRKYRFDNSDFIRDIMPKINNASKKRKEYGIKFLGSIQVQNPNIQNLLQLISLYVNA